MRLPFDLLSQTYTKPDLYLCETDKTKICKLDTIEMQATLRFNSYSELTFTVGRTYDDMMMGEQKINPFYNKIEALRLVYLEGFGYFEIQDPEVVSDGIREVKEVTAYSLEYTLSQKHLEEFYINTGEHNSVEIVAATSIKNLKQLYENGDVDRYSTAWELMLYLTGISYDTNKSFEENKTIIKGTIDAFDLQVPNANKGNALPIVPVSLYNPIFKSLSLMHLVFEKVYGWSVAHIDSTIQTLTRKFEISRSSVYDFITQDICDQFNCFVVFDTYNNQVSVYSESPLIKFEGNGEQTKFYIYPALDAIDHITIDSYKTTKWNSYIETIGGKDNTVIEFLTAPSNKSQIVVVDGSQTEYMTDIYVSFDNLAQEINISYSAEDIKTSIKVKGADDLDIRDVNMGQAYITDISYYHSVDWMGHDLYHKYSDYLDKVSKLQSDYTDNVKAITDVDGRINYEKYRLSLQYSIASHVSNETIGKYYVRGGGVILTSEQKEIAKIMKSEFDQTSIDLTIRPKVSWEDMHKAGWYTEEGSYSTLDTVTFLSSDFDSIYNNGDDYAINFTPILPNGYVINGGHDGLWDYINKKLQSGISFQNMNDIFIGIYNSLEDAEAAAERLHVLQEQFYQYGFPVQNYYYTEVQLPAEYNGEVTYYTLSGTDLNKSKASNFCTALQEYYNSKNEKKVEKIDELSKDFAFIEKYTISQLSTDLKAADTTEKKDAFVKKFLDLMWDQVGKEPLYLTYKEAFEEWETSAVDKGWNDSSNANYWLYHPLTIILTSIEDAIKIRDDKIKEYEGQRSDLQKISNDLMAKTNLTNNFNHKELIRLNSFIREDEYTDDNFAITDSDSIDMIVKKKQELLECGKIELAKLSSPKLQFSMDMANIYALPEFEPIIDQFQLGKLINIKLRDTQTQTFYIVGDGNTTEFLAPPDFDEVKKIEFINSEEIACEYDAQAGLVIFDTAPEFNAQMNITLVKYYLKQSRLLEVDINFNDFTDFSCEFGDLTSLRTPSSIHADLLASAMQAGKSVTSNASYWDRGADLATSTDLKIQQGLIGAINGLYTSDQSVTIDNNGILLRKVNDDGSFSPYQAWLTSNNILLSDDGFHEGSEPQLGLGEFVVDGVTFYGILAKAVLSGYIEGSTIVGGTINIGNGTFMVDRLGNVTMNAASIKGYVEEDGVISSINQSPESITINANKISLAGKSIDLTSDNIAISSTNFSVTKDGKITARSGEIAGWIIGENSIEGSSGNYKALISKSAIGTSGNVVFGVYDGSAWSCYMDGVGKLYASNADIKGKITATSGSIAGYNIGSGGSYSNAIYKRVDGSSADYEVGMKATSGTTDLAFYVKESVDNWANSTNTFYIRNNGQLYAQDAVITGEINATSGNIGGCTISNGVLNVDAARITSGTIATARIPNLSADKITAGTIHVDRIPSLSADKITVGTLNADRIPNISASKITSGTINASNVSVTNLNASNITSGTLSTSRLSSSVITTDNFSSKSLSTGSLTVASGCRLGAASEYNALLYTVGDYTNVRAFGPDVNYGISWYALIKQAVQLSASSRDIKTEIHDFDDRYDEFFNNLNPQLYKYDFATANGYSMGYIWEETKDASLKAGLANNDIGAVSETESVPGGKELNRTDFIALNTWQIQKLKARVEELENKLAALEA